MFQLSQLAEFKTLYPEKAGPLFSELLKGISKETLQKVATHLIGYDLFSGKQIDNKQVIENWFSQANQAFAQDLFDRIEAYRKKTGRTLHIIHTISCLKILQHGLALEEQGQLNTKSKEQSEIDLLLAMLVCNQNEDADQTKDNEKIEKAFPDDYPAALLLNMGFPVSDIINFHFSDYTYCQIVKSLRLFKFLESKSECTTLLNEFYSFLGIAHWKEYFERIIPVITAWSSRSKASSVDIVLHKDDHYDDNYAFLKKLSLSEYARMEDVDYIKIREKPLMELDNTTFRIVHPLFLSDKVYKSLYFLFNQLYGKTDKKLGGFRTWYTSHFSEGTCFREAIQRSFPYADQLLFDNDLANQTPKVVGPPDSYLRIQNSSFLFENKDILINAAIKSSYDFDALIEELKKKLFNEEGRPVGIGQLITNIRKLLSGENKYDPGFVAGSTNIYPILVTHDNMFDTAGLNRVMGSLYNSELKKLEADGLDIKRVKPITFISIDTFLLIQHLLRSKKINLAELIELYHKESDTGATGFISFSDYVIAYLDRQLGNWRSQELLHLLFK
ncbi:MAG TPA: hypothetical protein VFS36_00515 [Chitinophagaceae bacterium]|jgi:hypothetical protein|nr:hypothetical protein [Chitinophagaceae bacterium]